MIDSKSTLEHIEELRNLSVETDKEAYAALLNLYRNTENKLKELKESFELIDAAQKKEIDYLRSETKWFAGVAATEHLIRQCLFESTRGLGSTSRCISEAINVIINGEPCTFLTVNEKEVQRVRDIVNSVVGNSSLLSIFCPDTLINSRGRKVDRVIVDPGFFAMVRSDQWPDFQSLINRSREGTWRNV